MFLSDLSIKQPVFATMMMAALAVLGLTSYRAAQGRPVPRRRVPGRHGHDASTPARRRRRSSATSRRRSKRRSTPSRASATSSRPRRKASRTSSCMFNIGVPTLNAVAGHPRQGGGDPRRAAARDRRADHPAHRLRRDADRVGGASNAPALTPQAATDIADKLVKRRLENVPGRRRGQPGGRERSARSRWWSTGRGSRPTASRSRRSWTRCGRENVDAPAGTADRGATEAMVRVAARGRGGRRHRATSRSSARATRRSCVRDVAQVIDGVEEPKNLALAQRAAGDRARRAEAVGRQHGGRGRRRARPRSRSCSRSCRRASSLQIVRDDSTFIRESIDDVQR